MSSLNETAHRILDAAERHTQTLGFNAFSYKDLQKDVGVKTSSIHYYFPSKSDLAIAMLERYLERFEQALTDIPASCTTGVKQLEALAQLYAHVHQQGKFCLCGMLASDLATLPGESQGLLESFFTLNERWIQQAIECGQSDGSIQSTIDARKAAALFLAALEGGMLIARTRQKTDWLKTVTAQAIAQLRG